MHAPKDDLARRFKTTGRPFGRSPIGMLGSRGAGPPTSSNIRCYEIHTTTLSALLLVWLFIGCRGPQPSRTTDDLGGQPSHEGYVEAEDGVRLFYRMVGTGDTVIVIHGGPGFTMDYFADDLAPLSDELTLLFYDQRGTGRSTLVSDSSALAAQKFAEDLEAIRTHFRLNRLTLLGHSWGAGVAALYAGKYPDHIGRLLVVGGVPLQRSELVSNFQDLAAGRDSTTRHRMQELWDAQVANPGDASLCREYYALWFRPFYGDAAASERSKGDFCAGGAEALRNKMQSVDRYTAASLGDWDLRSSLDAVKAPALVIHGTSDVLSVESARTWAAALPNSRLLLLDGVGHFPYLEASGRFFPAVHDFLSGTWPEGAQETTAR